MQLGCCLMALLGALWPRVILVCLWLFADWHDHLFKTRLWPILGFIFLPATTLAYVLIQHYVGSIDNPWLILLGMAFLHDLGQLRVFRGPRRPSQNGGPAKRARFVDPE